jgi:hypothetical protein
VIVHQLVEQFQLVHHTAIHFLAAAAPTGGGDLDPNPIAPPGLAALGTTFIAWAKWILRICGVVGLIICGIMMTVGRRQRSAFAADGAAGIPWVLGGLTLGAIAAIIVPSVAL